MKAEFCNEIIQGLKELVDALYFLNYGEIQLKFEEEKIASSGLNHSSTVYYTLEIPKDSIEEYYIEQKRNISLDLDIFRDVMKRIKKNYDATLSTEKYKMKIVLENNGKTSDGLKERKTYILHTLYNSTEDKEPKYEPQARFTVSSDFLRETIGDCVTFSDVVKISVNDQILNVDGGDQYVQVKGSTKLADPTPVELLGRYSKNYILVVVNCLARLSDEVVVEMGYNEPLILGIDEIDNVDFKLKFMIAPRV